MSNAGARWQRGTLVRSVESWTLRIREDFTAEDGALKRREKSLFVACCTDVRTRTHARILADAMIDRITGRGFTPGASMLAGEYLRRYIAEHLVSKKRTSQSTIKGRINRHLIPAVGRLRLEQITPRIGQQMVAKMLEKGLHSTTIRDAVRLLVTIMKRAKLDGLACQLFDVRSISMPAKAEADVERQVFTADEVMRLVAYGSARWRIAYALQATLGLRRSEVLGLAWRDFNPGSVNIRRQAVRGRIQSLKSKASAKPLAVSSALAAMLEEYRQTWRVNPDDLLFVTRNNTPVHDTWYGKKLTADIKRLGLPHRGSHAFRHFTASHLLQSGKSVAATRDHLRHSNVSITNTYAHALGADLREAAELMGDVLTRSAQQAAQLAGNCGPTQPVVAGK